MLAVPRTALGELSLDRVTGLIIDATNPWEATGTAVETDALSGLKVPVIRTLNHIAYNDLTADSQVLNPNALPRAVALVDSGPGTGLAQQFVESLGFDSVPVPPAAASLFEPEGELFGVFLTAENIRSEVAMLAELAA